MNRPITVNGEPLDFVDNFLNLGNLISKDNGAQKDIKARLGKAQGASHLEVKAVQFEV